MEAVCVRLACPDLLVVDDGEAVRVTLDDPEAVPLPVAERLCGPLREAVVVADAVRDIWGLLEVDPVLVPVRDTEAEPVPVRDPVVVLDTDVLLVLVLVGRPETVGPGELVPVLDTVAVLVLVGVQ